MKHIAINGYFLSRPFTGFGVYSNGLIKALIKNSDPKEWQITVFCPTEPEVKSAGAVKIKVLPEKKRFGASLDKIIWEQFMLPKAAKKDGANIIHHFYPATSVFNKGIKQLTSIHDATPWHFAAHTPSPKIVMFRKFQIWSNRKADHFLSVSNYGREDVAEIYNIPKEDIEVVYNGIDERFLNPVSESEKKRVKEKYQLPDKYIFYIGGFEVHKNVKRLFLSYARAVSEINQHLVVAGGVFSKSRVNVYKDFFDLPGLINNYKLDQKVHMIGVVPDEDLPALYQMADLFVMPSLAEGFNLPLVQAFASHTPAIASNSPASVEISGGAAELVDATNVEELAAKIVFVLSDQKTRQELISKGFERQKSFRWDAAASRLLSIYGQMTE